MRTLCWALILCMLFGMPAYAAPAWPSDTGIQAEAGVVMDLDSGTVIFAQNSHVAYPPASITKILTALIVLEHCDLADTVTFSETAMNSVEADSGNKLSLVAGDSMSVEDCLYALLLASVNQAANALAEHTAGSIPAFVDMMNEKIAELGCQESHFDNPSGLNGDTQNVSAYDMALIARAAYSNPKLLEISSAQSHSIPATANNPDGATVRQEHRLVITEDETSPYYYPEAVAGKTGYLIKAGNTLVTYAEKDGRRLVSVILKGSPRQYFVDGKTLLEFGFARFKNVEIAEAEGRYVTGDGTISLGGTDYTPGQLAIEKGVVVTLPDNAQISDAALELGPVGENAPDGALAVMNYTYNERKIGSAYLMTREGAEALEAARAAGQDENAGAAENGGETGDADGTAGDGGAAVNGTSNGSGAADSGSEPATDDGEGSVSEPAADGNNAGGEKDTPAGRGLPAGLFVGIGVLVLAGAGAGLFFWIREKRRKEAADLLRRREARRKRLMEEGSGVEEEFERLLAEKKTKERKRE